MKHRVGSLTLASVLALASFSLAAAEGDIDSRFGKDGIAPLGIADDRGAVSDALVQPDGKILVCGSGLSDDGQFYGGYLWRLNPDGTADSAFGTNGHVFVNDQVYDQPCAGIALQPDGRIIAVLTKAIFPTPVTSTFLFSVMRFNIDGNVDQGFNGGTGQAVVNLSLQPRDTEPRGRIAMLPDGGIAIVQALFPNRFALARLHADGTPDLTFGSSGHVLVDVPSPAERFTYVAGLLVDEQGRLAVGGSIDDTMIAVRILANGRIDEHFGESGIASLNVAAGSALVSTMKMQADGRIVFAGRVQFSQSSAPLHYEKVFAARMTADGRSDPSFGQDGSVLISDGEGLTTAYSAIVRNQRLVLVGSTPRAGGNSAGLLAELDSNGVPINAFGNGGLISYAFADAPNVTRNFYTIDMQGNNYIVAGTALDLVSHVSTGFVVRILGARDRPGHSTHSLPRQIRDSTTGRAR